MTIRKRGWDQIFSGTARSPGSSTWKPYTFKMTSYEKSEGGSHGGYNHLGNGDIGGPWFLDRYLDNASPIIRNGSQNKGPYVCLGLNSFPGQAFVGINDSDVKADGTKAVKLTAPNNPSFSLSTAVGELLKDGLPAMFGSGLLEEKTRVLRGSSQEYLNYQFGWLPLMSDLRKFAHTVRDTHRIIDGFREGSAQHIRRRHVFEPVRTFVNFEGSGYLYPANGGASVLVNGSQTQEDLVESWFSGAFRYHIPLSDNFNSKAARWYSEAGKLLGLRLTPDVVWNIAPWSWAVDWYANVGDVLTNIGNLGSDGLAMQYGYSMRHKRTEVNTVFYYQGQTGYRRRTWEQKRRLPASPYGFMVTYDGLTDRQKAIAAALGITRVR